METNQTKFWKGDFGDQYTDRCSVSQEEWDKYYLKSYGVTKIEINRAFVSGWPEDVKILEVGCNVGLQLGGLQRMGFKNLYGIELSPYAAEKAKEITKGVNIINASGFDIPYKDNYFDVVCTNGVLIHIAPDDHKTIMSEIFRCSKKFIWGFEYYSEKFTNINYRGNENYLWKGDFAGIYMNLFPNLKMVKKQMYPYINETEKGNVDYMFLLEKRQ